MKKTIISCFIATQIFISAFSQSEKFTAAMSATLQQYGAAKTADENAAVAAKFERIGEAEKTQWLPYYYAALVKVNMTWTLKSADDKDKLADEASALISKAEALEKENSEIFCLKAMVATAKMAVNPMERWQQYGADINSNIELAKKTDTNNPRPYALQAMNLKNTPETFGGGCKTAKPLADKANALFEGFKPASAIHPSWGKDILAGQMKSCN